MNTNCPICGQPARFVFGPTQAMCGTEWCRVMTFNPSLPDGGLSTAAEVNVDDLCQGF